MLFIDRLLKHYEYHPDDCYHRLADIVAHLQSDEEMSQQNGGKPVSHCQARLRPIIRDFWDGKVFFTNRRFQKGSKRVRALKHLRRKDLKSSSQSESDSSASKHLIMVPGWQVVINNDKSLSILRVEDWLLDGERVVTEIRADQGDESPQYACTISSHGRKLYPKDLGLKLGQMANPKEELELLAKCMSSSKLCKGFNFTFPGMSTSSEVRFAEYSCASDPSKSEMRAFSSSCLLVCASKSTCVECVKCRKVLRQKIERDRDQFGKANAKVNHRFMTREQLLFKLKEMHKELQAYRQKIKRLEYGEVKEEPNDSDNDGNNHGSDNNDDGSNDSEDDNSNSSDDGSDDNEEDGDDDANDGEDDSDATNAGGDDNKDDTNVGGVKNNDGSDGHEGENNDGSADGINDNNGSDDDDDDD